MGRRMVLQSLFISCLLRTTHSAGDICGSFKFPSSKGSVESPKYPKVKKSYDCERRLSFPPGGGFIIVEVTDIKLFYKDDDNKKQCSMSFEFGNYTATCPDPETEEPCIAYYNSKNCAKAAAILQPRCKVYKTSNTEVQIRVQSSGNWTDNWFPFTDSYPKGVKLDYMYLPCPAETTTATMTSTISHILTTTEPNTTIATTTTPISQTKISTETQNATMERGIIIKDLEDSSNATEAHSNSTFSDFYETDDQRDYTAIAVCSVLIFLLMLATVVVLVLRRRNRNKTKSSAQENEYQDFGDGSADVAHSVAYVRESQSNNAEQDTYHTIAAPDQSENNTYSRIILNPVVGQSNGLSHEMDQSENTNAYSTLNLESQRHQSNSQNQDTDLSESANAYSTLNLNLCTMDQSDGSIYSTISKEPQRRENNHQNSEEKQPSPEMVDNVLYETR